MDSQTERSVARAAENEVIFRNANQEIERRRAELDVPGLTPFFCECEEESCKTLISLGQEEYADARVKPNWFILSPGHKFRSGTIRSRTDRFMLVEKDGLAKEIAERDAIP
jgi:hypothetical protein